MFTESFICLYEEAKNVLSSNPILTFILNSILIYIFGIPMCSIISEYTSKTGHAFKSPRPL